MAFIHSPRIVTDGLILYFDAANLRSYPGSGTVWSDLSGNNNSGSLTNGPTFDNTGGGSIVLDGSNDSVDCGTYTFNATNGTISYWFKPTTSITTSVNKRPWGSNGNFEARWNDGSGTLVHDIGATASLTSGTNSWSNTIWYNATLTWDSQARISRFYVQGVLDATGNTATTATLTVLTGTFYIGRSSTTQYLDARFSIFSIYNRALSAQEVLQNFNAQRSRFGI